MIPPEITKLMAIVAACFPHLPPDETTVAVWKRSRRLQRITFEVAVDAVVALAERSPRYALSEICDEADRIARQRRVERTERQLPDVCTRELNPERERIAAQVTADVIAKRVRFETAAEFNAEVARRLCRENPQEASSGIPAHQTEWNRSVADAIIRSYDTREASNSGGSDG